jgi:hypothetical protein
LIDRGTYVFYNSTMTRNQERYRQLPGKYSTDLIATAANGFLDDAIASNDATGSRFFLGSHQLHRTPRPPSTSTHAWHAFSHPSQQSYMGIYF